MKKTLLLILLTASLPSCSIQTSYGALSQAEKDMLLTVEDLNGLGLGYRTDSSKAKCSAVTLAIPHFKIPLSRTCEYELNYENASVPGQNLFLSNSITKTPGPNLGIRGFVYRKAVESILGFSGISMREPSGFRKLCPGYRFFILEKDGSPIGNYICFTAGGADCTVMLSAVYFSDPALWEPLCERKIRAISSCMDDTDVAPGLTPVNR